MTTEIIIVMACIGVMVWIVGMVIALAIISVVLIDNDFSALPYFFLIEILIGIFGWMFMIPGILEPVEDFYTKYIPPTSIIKQNEVMFINYVKDGKEVASLTTRDIVYWNSTNIAVEVFDGNNINGHKIVSYAIVPHALINGPGKP